MKDACGVFYGSIFVPYLVTGCQQQSERLSAKQEGEIEAEPYYHLTQH